METATLVPLKAPRDDGHATNSMSVITASGILELPCASIVEGPNARADNDLGDLEGLAQTIKERGLTHPITVRPWPAGAKSTKAPTKRARG